MVRRLATECAEGFKFLELMDNDAEAFEKISCEMREFLTKQFENPMWERQLQARWLRKRQLN